MSHPAGEHAAHPSIWPVTVSLGLALLVFGIVTSLAFTAVGVLLTLAGTGGWIAELRHDG